MTQILTREQMHKLLDAVLDIAECGEGSEGYPYVGFEVSGHPVNVSLITRKQGDQKGYDLFENIFAHQSHKTATYKRWMEHLKKLKKERPHEAKTS